LDELRSEYFTSNPDSPYRDAVNHGTIVAGMGRFDVLASWGRPNIRSSDSADQEKWTYFDVDSESGDAIEYNLLFQDGSLDRWKTRTVKNTGMAYRSKTEEQNKIVPADPPGGKKVPTN